MRRRGRILSIGVREIDGVYSGRERLDGVVLFAGVDGRSHAQSPRKIRAD